MKKRFRVLTAMILVLCLLLSGCSLDFAGYFQQMLGFLVGGYLTDFNDMEYTRPDVEALQSTVDACCEKIPEASSLNEVVAIIYEAYAPLNAYSTAYALAQIYYSKDLTDTYWSEEYAFCSENVGVVQAAQDKFFRALAKSEFREELETDEYYGEGFFEDFEGDSIYDETFTALLGEEAALENQYYALWNEAAGVDIYSEEFFTDYGDRMAGLFVELVAIRQEMATYLGYESYPEFAYEYYYGRDYTCQQTTSYLADIRAELVPMYEELISNGVDVNVGPSDESATLAYVREMAYAMGGTIQEAYDAMIRFNLYDISYSENKYEASFEVFIRDYYTPYLFINPTLTEQDKLTMAHEFGHFCCDYAAFGSGAGVDVAEVFSQGMEYLSLCYVENVGDLETLKMVSCLSVMVEQSAYASFEQQVYELEGEELNAENIRALFEQVSDAYGFQSLGLDSRSYVYVTHFFTNPMYVISYVVSNDVALQLYQMELQEDGKGLAAMESAYETIHSGIVAFTEEYGLESPFAAGRIASIKETLQQAMN